eukprot:m.74042 g.74042  ORF g.74042 m.74042 type:complete len:589 (+) comp8043_c0_seq3:141-1907(+)
MAPCSAMQMLAALLVVAALAPMGETSSPSGTSWWHSEGAKCDDDAIRTPPSSILGPDALHLRLRSTVDVSVLLPLPPPCRTGPVQQLPQGLARTPKGNAIGGFPLRSGRFDAWSGPCKLEFEFVEPLSFSYAKYIAPFKSALSGGLPIAYVRLTGRFIEPLMLALEDVPGTPCWLLCLHQLDYVDEANNVLTVKWAATYTAIILECIKTTVLLFILSRVFCDVINSIYAFCNPPGPDAAAILHGFEFGPEHVVVATVIGVGSFGVVHHAMISLPRGPFLAAAKRKTDGSIVELLQEYEMMAQLEHPNIVRANGRCFKDGDLYIIMENFVFGDLAKFASRVDQLSTMSILRVTLDIASGLKYLFEQGILHCDLSRRNVFVDSRLFCKIGDFGLSRYETDNLHIPARPPLRNISPDSLRTGEFSRENEIWLIGLIMWELYEQRGFYSRIDRNMLRDYVLNQASRTLGRPTGMFAILYHEIMKPCIAPLEERISVDVLQERLLHYLRFAMPGRPADTPRLIFSTHPNGYDFNAEVANAGWVDRDVFENNAGFVDSDDSEDEGDDHEPFGYGRGGDQGNFNQPQFLPPPPAA